MTSHLQDRDALPADPRDASRVDALDASSRPGCNASPRASRDTSRGPLADASREYSADTSRRAAPNASASSSGDASRVDRADASRPPGGEQLVLLEGAPVRGPGAPCAWCGREIPAEGKNGRPTRRDARTCRQHCRQALHRFRVGLAGAAASDRAMRFCYADPPYPGMAARYYSGDPECAEVDHVELVARLVEEFPDGWALSTSSEALQDVLALCPKGTRTCPWVKGARASKSTQELDAWEPLLVYGGRKRPEAVVSDLTNVLLFGGRQHSHPGALVGMKPAPFAEWMFRLLGACLGDELVDLFPGSGAISRAWTLYTSQAPARTALPSRLAGATSRLFLVEDVSSPPDEP